ncbi:MAG: anthranilate synthase component II [Methanomethylophilus sp.]
MILIIDNYDSFSYNLYQLIGSLDPTVQIARNDALTVEQIEEMSPEAVILSPGPGRPENAGICMEAAKELDMPVLGVCLGHQAICAAFGGRVTYAKRIMHGKQSVAKLKAGEPLFAGLPSEIKVGRYHSLAADPASMPDCLETIAETADGEIMAVRHKARPVYGLQFHPESILTPDGPQIMRNFLGMAEDYGKE